TAQGSGDGIFVGFDGRQSSVAESNWIGNNRGHYLNPALDRLIEQLSATIDVNEQAQILRQEGAILAAELPALPVYFRLSSTSVEDLYKRRRGHTDPQTSLDIDAAIAHLQVQPLVKPGPVGIIGFCMGGRVAYYIAGTNPNIAVAADCYGGGLFVSEGGSAPIEYTSNIHCPVILLDGELDRNPSPQDLEAIQAELKKHGVTHEAHIYPGVGHGFMGEEPSDTNPKANVEAWKQVWAWFHRHLETAPNTYVQTRIPAPQR